MRIAPVKRILGVLVAMAAIGAAAASVHGVNLARQKAVMAHAEALGKTRLAQAELALAQLHRQLEPAVSRAAALPELRAALAVHLAGQPENAPALGDLLAGAPWWAEVRKAFPAYLVAVDGQLLVHNQGSRALERPAMVDVAARRGRVSGFAFLVGRPWLAAADRVPVGNHQVVLLLARALDDASLASLAPALADGALLLADGQRLLARFGPGADGLAERVAHDHDGWQPRAPVTRVVPMPDDRFAITAGKALAAQLNLWVGTTSHAPENAIRTANVTRAAILAGAALIAVLAVALGYRRDDQRVGSRSWSPRDAT